MKTQLTINQSLDKALKYQESGLLTEAKELYKTILKEDTKNFKAFFELANCFNKTKDYKNALFYFKEAIKSDNKSYLAHFNMAKIYDKLSKFEFCIFHLEKAIKILPSFYEALFSMAQCYRKMKDEDKMVEYLNKTLAEQPEHAGANHLLASQNNQTSSEYSSKYAEDLFDRYAGHFEKHLVTSLKYQVPNIIKEKLISLNPSKNSKVLDLGCGTGLVGKTIVEQFPNLVGVDISSNMVEETRKKEIYSNLFVSDIHEFLLKNQQKFDLVIAADVFIYIGKLQEIFKNLKNSLSDKAYFIFTIELFKGTSKNCT